MRLSNLIHQTRLYTRDNNSYMFKDNMITMFLNEAIDRVRQYKPFFAMKHLDLPDDEPNILPQPYHYMLGLFAASRCFEHDERFYEAVERRNEFESLFEQLLSDLHSGNVVLQDDEGSDIEDLTSCTDVVKDVYFKSRSDEDAVTVL